VVLGLVLLLVMGMLMVVVVVVPRVLASVGC
jgi:hypothetical protein